MRIAIISDVHGNLTALEAVAKDIRTQGADHVYHLGDLVANGARPSEVLDLIRTLGWEGVYGNTDEMLWRPDLLEALDKRWPQRKLLRRVLISEIAPITTELIGAQRLAYLQQLPMTLDLGSVFLCHAGVRDVWSSPRERSSDRDFEAAYGGLNAAMVVYGHVHVPFTRRLEAKEVVNAGALSLSYDGDWRASYVIVENGQAVHRRVEYDLRAEVEALRNSRLPRIEWLEQLLTTAQYRDPF